MDHSKIKNIEYLLNGFESTVLYTHSAADDPGEYDIMIESDKEKYLKAIYILSTMDSGNVYTIYDFTKMVECGLVKDEYGYGKYVDDDCEDMDHLGAVECNLESLDSAECRGAVYVKWHTKQSKGYEL